MESEGASEKDGPKFERIEALRVLGHVTTKFAYVIIIVNYRATRARMNAQRRVRLTGDTTYKSFPSLITFTDYAY
jgi:hypothetical protein